MKLKLVHLFNSCCSLNIFREGAEFVSLSKLFQSFVPRKENAFWQFIVFSNGILTSVSDERRNNSLSSELFMNNFLK